MDTLFLLIAVAGVAAILWLVTRRNRPHIDITIDDEPRR